MCLSESRKEKKKTSGTKSLLGIDGERPAMYGTLEKAREVRRPRTVRENDGVDYVSLL